MAGVLLVALLAVACAAAVVVGQSCSTAMHLLSQLVASRVLSADARWVLNLYCRRHGVQVRRKKLRHGHLQGGAGGADREPRRI